MHADDVRVNSTHPFPCCPNSAVCVACHCGMTKLADAPPGASDALSRARSSVSKIPHGMTLSEPDSAKLATWMPSSEGDDFC